MGKDKSNFGAERRRCISRTPSHVCTLILPPSHPDGLNSSEISSQSKLESTFIRQTTIKERIQGSISGSTISMVSNSSGGTLASYAELSKLPLKRTTSFTSITSNTSQQKLPHQSSYQSQGSQSAASSHYYSTSSFAVPANPHSGSLMKIAFGKYLLVPSSDGRIHVYYILDFRHAENCVQDNDIHLHTFHRTESRYKNIASNRGMAKNIQKVKEAVQPICSLGPFTVGDYRPASSIANNRKSSDKKTQVKASIVDLSTWGNDHENDGDSAIVGGNSALLGNLAVLTQEGDVHVFQFQTNESLSESDFHQLKVEHSVSFFSGHISATAIAGTTMKRMTKMHVMENIDRYRAETILIISVGFENGIISEYIIKNNSKATLRWEGRLESSVSSMEYITRSQDKIIDDSRKTNNEVYLVVGISQESSLINESEENSMISCVDVINSSLVERDFKSSSSSPSSTLIELKEYIIWPTHNWKSKKFDQQKNPHHKSDYQGFAITSAVDIYSGSHQSFSVLLSNGSVITLAYWFNDINELRWGIRRHRRNRAFQPFSICGIGGFGSDSIACCTRGGTIYTFPSKEAIASAPVELNGRIIYNLPLGNGVDDGVARYVQGFAAGCIRVKTWGVRSNTRPVWNIMPIFFLALPGGAVDCFTCDAENSYSNASSLPSERHKALLLLLLSNGTLAQLFQLLSSIDQLNAKSSLWEASKELQTHPLSPDEFVKRIMEEEVEGFQNLYELVQDLIVGRHISIA